MQRHFAKGVDTAHWRRPDLRFNRKDGLQAQWIRRLSAEIEVPIHWVPSTQAFVDAALAASVGP